MSENRHKEAAEDALARADDWANRDNVGGHDRERIVTHWLIRSQIHATLAVAEAIGQILYVRDADRV